MRARKNISIAVGTALLAVLTPKILGDISVVAAWILAIIAAFILLYGFVPVPPPKPNMSIEAAINYLLKRSAWGQPQKNGYPGEVAAGWEISESASLGHIAVWGRPAKGHGGLQKISPDFWHRHRLSVDRDEEGSGSLNIKVEERYGRHPDEQYRDFRLESRQVSVEWPPNRFWREWQQKWYERRFPERE